MNTATPERMPPAGPQIILRLSSTGVCVKQQRPPITSTLHGREATTALATIPLLLPVCGIAQQIAGERAVAAAQGQAETREARDLRDAALRREQINAAAWRLTIDWPKAVDYEPDLAALKAIRDAADTDKAADALSALLPAPADLSTLDKLASWSRASGEVAALLLQRTEIDGPGKESQDSSAAASESSDGFPATVCAALRGDRLRARAEAALAAKEFEPDRPAEQPVEVGPRAMMRHPSFDAAAFPASAWHRLAATLLDMETLARPEGSAETDAEDDAWQLADGSGLGRAMTARGPVFHRVVLDRSGQVESWRVVAPTDWHFAGNGPLVAKANAEGPIDQTGLEELKLEAVSLDPCAPFSIDVEDASSA